MESMQPCDWAEARSRAASFRRRLEPVLATPEEAVGGVLAEPLIARTDMPAYDVATTDGWAVSGPGPWRVRRPTRRDMLAGMEYHESSEHVLLRDGQAAPASAGEPLGQGVTGVVAGNRCRVEGELLKLVGPGGVGTSGSSYIEPGSGVRARGSDAGLGSELLPAGERVSPAVAALAASAGHDAVSMIPMPSVALIRIGTEVLDRGVPRAGLARDAVSPALPGWIAGLRGRAQPARWVTTGDAELIEEIDDVIADVVVTTGLSSDAALRRVLQGMHADVLVDGVRCRPGRLMLLAQLQDGRPLIHCGGSPADAISTLVTLLSPIIAALTGLPDPANHERMNEPLPGDRRLTSLLPVTTTGARTAGVSLVRPGGPGGLFALSRATGLAVIPPGGARLNESVTVLPLP